MINYVYIQIMLQLCHSAKQHVYSHHKNLICSSTNHLLGARTKGEKNNNKRNTRHNKQLDLQSYLILPRNLPLTHPV